MHESEKSHFGELMMGLSALYQQSMTNALLGLYWNALKQFEFNLVTEAINSHVRNPDCGQFMPKIADLVRFLEGSFHTQALIAWDKVIKNMKQHGAYQSVVFDDALIQVVISEMGGWITLCHLKESDLSYRAREFEKRYVGHLIRAPKQFPKKLTGIFEQQNLLGHHDIAPPLLLGDVVKAANILKSGSETLALAHMLATPENLKSIEMLAHQALALSDTKYSVENSKE